eukprot:scaffold1192_cov179-Ochromonas_danica.AAC.3
MYGQQRRRNNGISPVILGLLWQIFSQLEHLPVKPVVTIALLGLNILVHVHPYPTFLGYSLANVGQNCINPRLILSSLLQGKGLLWNRLLLAGFMHADDMHLYYNMLSLCWKGVQLEGKMGPAGFLYLVVFSLIVSHSLLVLIAGGLHEMKITDDISGYSTCAIGFSAVLFSLKYVLNYGSPERTMIAGLAVPAKYAAWLELVLISIVTPNASFLGHLAGILAGWIYIHLPGLTMSLEAPRYTYRRSTLNESTTDQEVEEEEVYYEEISSDAEIELEDVDDLNRFYSGPSPSAEELRAHRLQRYDRSSTTSSSQRVRSNRR